VIIDNIEVVFLRHQKTLYSVQLKGGDWEIFKPYFEEIWDNAIPIKDGKKVYQKEIDFINQNYMND